MSIERVGTTKLMGNRNIFCCAVTHELISTMNCKQAQALMSAAVDGELTLNEQEGFEKHIMKCPTCFSEFKEAQKTKSIIKEKITRFKAPQSLVNSILKLTETPL